MLRSLYIKSPHHQEIKVDGAIGGPSPTSDHIAMSVYTERNAIPQVVVHSLSEDGKLGDEILEKRETKDGVVRSVLATLHMNLRQSVAVRDWLSLQIDEIKKHSGKKQ